jgi:hypothetical protein
MTTDTQYPHPLLQILQFDPAEIKPLQINRCKTLHVWGSNDLSLYTSDPCRSKKRVSFEAAVGLHFAYYNFSIMLKTLVVIAVLFIIAQAPLPSNREAIRSHSQSGNALAQNATGGKTPPPPAQTVPKGNEVSGLHPNSPKDHSSSSQPTHLSSSLLRLNGIIGSGSPSG